MQSIAINGTQIHSNTTDLGFVVNLPIMGLDWPAVRIAQYDKPGEHGSIVSSQFYSGRTIIINGRVSGATVNQYLQNQRTLQNILRILMTTLNQATPLLLTLTTLDGLNLQTYCYVSKQPVFTQRSLNHAFFILNLYAEDYNLYDQSLQITTLNIPTGGGALYPVIYPVIYAAKTGLNQTIVNSGDSETYPVVTFTGPLTTPYIINYSLGTSFQVDLTLASTDVLVVDMAKKTMVLNGNQNAMQYFDAANTWLSLQPGNNVLGLSSSLSSDTGNAQIAFRNAFIGI